MGVTGGTMMFGNGAAEGYGMGMVGTAGGLDGWSLGSFQAPKRSVTRARISGVEKSPTAHNVWAISMTPAAVAVGERGGQARATRVSLRSSPMPR